MSELPATLGEDEIIFDGGDQDSGHHPKDPVTVTFAGHRGRVTDLKCSPFKRDIFMSVGSDQEIRIYSLLQPHAPARVIHQEECGVCQVKKNNKK